MSSRRLREFRVRASHHGALALWLPVLLMAASHARANERPNAPVNAAAMAVRLQALVDALRTELAIPQEVALEVVDSNPLMASVEPAKGGDGFVISIEGAFASRLTEDELKGVIAHELGHVWIFTHHPYLQTEQLANRIAMRLVSRENLAQVYEKVWKNGAKGDLGRFLGVAATTASVTTAVTAPAPEAPAATVEPKESGPAAPVSKDSASTGKATEAGGVRN